MGYDGPACTWSKKRVHGFLVQKLDRIMKNDKWLSDYPDFRIVFTPPNFSDHCAGWLNSTQFQQQKTSSFKFFNFHTKHKDFLSEVRRVWQVSDIRGTAMNSLCEKLKLLKPVLRTLCRRNVSDVHQRVVMAREKLLALQKDV